MYGLSKKKMPYLYLIDEAIGLLNTEIRLIEWRIKYPEQFKQRIGKQTLSPLYLADKTTLINIMEIVSSLFLSKDIVYQNGKPAYLVDLAKAFEWLFNIRIGDCYQKHEDVIKRKPGKLTEFLNGLAELIKKEHDKKGYR
ncbi:MULTISPECIES: RteC domain-containing protein [Bacteroidales]|uniref:RteC domain-containing protein n=1 Tax=Bacteroidales TaxID=171549 RepID=UPI00321ACA7D